MEDTMNNPKLVRVQEKGQVTLPREIRERLGLRKGDLVAFATTEEGNILVIPQEAVAREDIAEADRLLREQGLSLDEIIDSGRQIRGQLVKEMYGFDTDGDDH
jgi:AbrB family looped-hinge helix DNA binding protein